MDLFDIETPEFKNVAVKMDPNFFIDTRFASQTEIKNRTSTGILRKQQLDNIFDLRMGFPLKENIVYGTEMAGVNSKLFKKGNECKR
jgi:hypothetical protein